ncbi:MAG: efflux RND transporter periplasmic adaptor subunit [Pseudomonas sp.]|nr:efflux RND transporter periplasmic adaptor subunit [Pseudomonas sp.]MBQ0777149.1 efflux RND transporter periplasmic adaptor subunit [Pseudomonas sp.]
MSVLAVAALVSACGSDDKSKSTEKTPPMVTVQEVTLSDADLIQEYPARVRGAREVEVRARISGVLQERVYVEGADVKEGDILFRIFPEPMQILVKQAEAAKSNAIAEVKQAEREWERAKQLFERGALSASERDRTQSQLDFARAGLDEADALLDEAKLNLSYTNVRAPMDGSASLEVVPEGSVLAVGALLTTLVKQDPVHVIFALPERDAAMQRAAQIEDDTLNGAVTMLMADGSEYPRTGSIDFTSSSIDNATGSITLRAVFDNPDRQLIPGQFVRIRLVLKHFTDQVLLPSEAVGASGDGPQVLVVNDDSEVEIRKVKLGDILGARQIILEGVEPGDRVVVNGQVGLRAGAKVRVDGGETEQDPATDDAEE